MSTTYRVKDWQDNYENAETRRVKYLRWVPTPNKHDGKGYRRVAHHPRACELFTAWMLMLQVASKMPVRGVLADEDGPLSAEDLAMKTGFPEEVFALAFEALVNPRIGWLEVFPSVELANNPAPAADDPAPPAGGAGKDRAEGNGMEGNRKESPGASPSPVVPARESVRSATKPATTAAASGQGQGGGKPGKPKSDAPQEPRVVEERHLASRVRGVNAERVRKAVVDGDLVGVLSAFGCETSGAYADEWARDCDGLQLGMVVVILAWRLWRKDPVRLPSGWRQALTAWRTLGKPTKDSLVSELLAGFGIELPAREPVGEEGRATA